MPTDPHLAARLEALERELEHNRGVRSAAIGLERALERLIKELRPIVLDHAADEDDETIILSMSEEEARQTLRFLTGADPRRPALLSSLGRLANHGDVPAPVLRLARLLYSRLQRRGEVARGGRP